LIIIWKLVVCEEEDMTHIFKLYVNIHLTVHSDTSRVHLAFAWVSF